MLAMNKINHRHFALNFGEIGALPTSQMSRTLLAYSLIYFKSGVGYMSARLQQFDIKSNYREGYGVGSTKMGIKPSAGVHWTIYNRTQIYGQ